MANPPRRPSEAEGTGFRRRSTHPADEDAVSPSTSEHAPPIQGASTAPRSLPFPSGPASPPLNAPFSNDMTSTGSDAKSGSTSRHEADNPTRSHPLSATERRPSMPKHKNSDENVPHWRPETSAHGRDASPHSLDPATNRAAPTSSPNVSTPSQGARSRGLSLRTKLFQRNAHDRNADPTHGSAIELGPAGPSRPSNLTSAPPSRSSPSKKSMDTTVQIKQIDSGESTFTYDFAKPMDKERTGRFAALPGYGRWFREQKEHPLVLKARAGFTSARNIILRYSETPPTKDGRHIDLDPRQKDTFIDERTGKHYLGNTIRSSRYNIWNFVPRQLIAQFSKLANFYFLCVSILQLIPHLSTTGTYTTIAPLLFFVGISIAKEGYDDLRRYRLDKVENNQEATVLRSDIHSSMPGWKDDDNHDVDESRYWKKIKWFDVKVGDVVKLRRDDSVPADLVLLSSKGVNGVATIETMALDGETNLKSKQVHRLLSDSCKTPATIAASDVHFVVEDPNLDLYNFEGKVSYNGETAPLTTNEILYRGSILRNTPEAQGMVIYSGEECKIRMNANKNPRIKAPHLQKRVNRVVIIIVLFVIALSFFNTGAYFVARKRVERGGPAGSAMWYIANAPVPFFHIFAGFIIMFNTMIPLSLYVSLEIVKLCQMLLLNDIDMYDETTNTPFEARTSTINEELGQISYIFSDKTGTLTDNIMKFRKLSVAGTSWLHDKDLQGADNTAGTAASQKSVSKGKRPLGLDMVSFTSPFGNQERLSKDYGGDAGVPPKSASHSRPSTSHWHSSARPDKAQPEMSTAVMIDYIQRRPHTIFAKKAKMLLLAIALCHTCLPERDDKDKLEYQASSPDELALVRAANELEYIVWNREGSSLTIKTYPNGRDAAPVVEVYEVLDVIEFSSKRKRMSSIVRFPDGRTALLCKGADSVIMERLRLAGLARQKNNQIEARVNRRKSVEAQEVLRRRSSAVDGAGRSSFQRASLNINRRSIAVGRTSTSLQPIRNDVDSWLTDREHDVSAPPEPTEDFYEPRPSLHHQGRNSAAYSDAPSSPHPAADEELVEDLLAADEDAVLERCFQHVNDFATEGLRTLLYGHRFLDEDEYASWKKIYQDATTSLVNRQVMIEQAGELIEQSLELTGATAIEDKLQQGVPEAIDKLRRANIKMWMLTGDKRETAINIGHSCRLIKDYSTVTVLDRESEVKLEHQLAAAIAAVTSSQTAHSVVVIDGQTLATVDSDPDMLRPYFLDLAILADSVICCRASPSQKSGLVKAIRRRVHNAITLAIGDGANDIAMIQEAHVGIGITGREGLQAARVSDYSIAQFRFLVKLLLCHGRWNYVRVAKYTVGTFWKEMFFYLLQALYQRYNGFTGTSLFESWSLSLFNTIFTSLCVIFLGVFEKDLAASTLVAVPELYVKGQRNEAFNVKVYLSWMFMAAAEAMIVFWCAEPLFGAAQFTDWQSLFALGDLAFSAAVILINIKLQGIETHYITIMTVIAHVAGVGGWWLWNMILSLTYSDNKIYFVRGGFMFQFGRNVLWWAVLALVVVAVVAFEIGVRAAKHALMPTDTEIFQVLEKDPVLRARFEEASKLELAAGRDREGKDARKKKAPWKKGAGGAGSGSSSSDGQAQKKKRLSEEEEEEEEQARHREVEELIFNRPGSSQSPAPVSAAAAAHSRAAFASRAGAGKLERIQTAEEAVFVHDGFRAYEEQQHSPLAELSGDSEMAPQQPRRSTEIQEMLSRGFGNVRTDTLK